MKTMILPALLLALGLTNHAMAQTPTQNVGAGANASAVKPATGNTDGLKRRGSGKMASGISRNGNSNLSPTGPTNTQGSTSQGTASSPSPGGAPGTNVMEVTKRPSQQGVRRATNTTTTSGGINGKGAVNVGQQPSQRATRNDGHVRQGTRGATNASQRSTSGKTGSRRPTTQAGVDKEARTNDRNVGTPTPNTKGLGAPGTPQGSMGKTGQKLNN